MVTRPDQTRPDQTRPDQTKTTTTTTDAITTPTKSHSATIVLPFLSTNKIPQRQQLYQQPIPVHPPHLLTSSSSLSVSTSHFPVILSQNDTPTPSFVLLPSPSVSHQYLYLTSSNHPFNVSYFNPQIESTQSLKRTKPLPRKKQITKVKVQKKIPFTAKKQKPTLKHCS